MSAEHTNIKEAKYSHERKVSWLAFQSRGCKFPQLVAKQLGQETRNWEAWPDWKKFPKGEMFPQESSAPHWYLYSSKLEGSVDFFLVTYQVKEQS